MHSVTPKLPEVIINIVFSNFYFKVKFVYYSLPGMLVVIIKLAKG